MAKCPEELSRILFGHARETERVVMGYRHYVQRLGGFKDPSLVELRHAYRHIMRQPTPTASETGCFSLHTGKLNKGAEG